MSNRFEWWVTVGCWDADVTGEAGLDVDEAGVITGVPPGADAGADAGSGFPYLFR